LEPSIIKYWKDGKWRTAKGVFTDEEQVIEWYKRNRWRIDGMTVVVPLSEKPLLDE